MKKNSINLKICGITNSESIVTAANNKVKSLGFASNNLKGPNTCDDESLKELIKECNEYKIEAVLLTRYQTTLELIKQINYTKPKTISCSYFFEKSDLETLKKIFKRLRIGIAINPKNFNYKYFEKVANIIDVFYYDLNIYKSNNIETFFIDDCRQQIIKLKKLNKPIYIGGGINIANAKNIIKSVSPYGIDISRSLKDNKNYLCNNRLKKILKILNFAA